MLAHGWANRPRRDRLTMLTGALLLVITAAAWAGVIVQATAMSAGDMDAAAMAEGMPPPSLAPAGPVAFVGAWVVMMAAMMLPSAAPMILLYGTVARNQAARGRRFVPTWIFALGYLLVWAAFGVLVYLASRLVALALTTSMLLAAWAPYGVAAVLLVAGAYQFTPLKRVCLRACQGPLGFLMNHWKPGPAGALRMGLEHGLYCAGCCWGLMAVLVVAGAMGLPWVLLIAVVVAAEKLLPRGRWAARLTGVLLLGLGAWVALRPEAAMLLRA
jgi:predicted metal-binding membrane protein